MSGELGDVPPLDGADLLNPRKRMESEAGHGLPDSQLGTSRRIRREDNLLNILQEHRYFLLTRWAFSPLPGFLQSEKQRHILHGNCTGETEAGTLDRRQIFAERLVNQRLRSTAKEEKTNPHWLVLHASVITWVRGQVVLRGESFETIHGALVSFAGAQGETRLNQLRKIAGKVGQRFEAVSTQVTPSIFTRHSRGGA